MTICLLRLLPRQFKAAYSGSDESDYKVLRGAIETLKTCLPALQTLIVETEDIAALRELIVAARPELEVRAWLDIVPAGIDPDEWS